MKGRSKPKREIKKKAKGQKDSDAQANPRSGSMEEFKKAVHSREIGRPKEVTVLGVQPHEITKPQVVGGEPFSTGKPQIIGGNQ